MTTVPPPQDVTTAQKSATDVETDSDGSVTDITCSDSDYEQGDSDFEFNLAHEQVLTIFVQFMCVY